MKMWINLAVVFLVILPYYVFLSSYGNNKQMDPKNKTKWNCKFVELYETCETMESALSCGTTPYCIHCIWNTAFNPKAVAKEKCNSCQDAMDQGNIVTHEELVSKLKSGCNIHEKEKENIFCSELVQNLTARNSFWDVEKTDVSSLDICSFLGLCFSQFDVKFGYLRPEKGSYGNDRMLERRVSAENAATAKESKIYRILENGTRMNPSDWSTFPMFIHYSGQSSKHFCQFTSVRIRNGDVDWLFWITLATVIIVWWTILTWPFSKENNKPKIEVVV